MLYVLALAPIRIHFFEPHPDGYLLRQLLLWHLQPGLQFFATSGGCQVAEVWRLEGQSVAMDIPLQQLQKDIVEDVCKV